MVYEVNLQKGICNSENMLGAYSLIVIRDSGIDSHDAIIASDVNGTGLQGLDLSSCQDSTRELLRTCYDAASVAHGLL